MPVNMAPIVAAPAPPHIALTPLAVRLALGSTVGLVATVTDGAGAPFADALTWSSPNEAVATVDAQGLAFGVAAGTAQIRAAVGSVMAKASLTVAPAFDADGLRIAFVAQVYREIEFPVVTVIELCSSGPALCQRLDFPGLTLPPGPHMLLSGVAAPAFSPDSQRIAFDTDRDGNREICVLGVDGSNLVHLRRDPAADFSPSWSP
jgi:hypothetical protein